MPPVNMCTKSLAWMKICMDKLQWLDWYKILLINLIYIICMLKIIRLSIISKVICLVKLSNAKLNKKKFKQKIKCNQYCKWYVLLKMHCLKVMVNWNQYFWELKTFSRKWGSFLLVKLNKYINIPFYRSVYRIYHLNAQNQRQ